MDTKAVLKGLLDAAEDDWLALWMIAQDVEEQLGVEDPMENLEVTLGLVRQLLECGLRAGHSPAENDGVHFKPWPSQDSDAIIDSIRREWLQRAALPSWGDGTWFAVDRRRH
jgi:hypothetical protein